MAKKRRKSKSKPGLTDLIDNDGRLLIGLQKVRVSGTDQEKATADSLIRWHWKNIPWTPAQRRLIENIVPKENPLVLSGDRHKRVKKEGARHYKSGEPFKNPYSYLGGRHETYSALFQQGYDEAKRGKQE